MIKHFTEDKIHWLIKREERVNSERSLCIIAVLVVNMCSFPNFRRRINRFERITCSNSYTNE